MPQIPSNIIMQAAGINLVLAAVLFALRWVSVSGAIAGALIGFMIYVSMDWNGFAVMAVFVVVGSLVTKLGFGKKERLGGAQSEGGRRMAKHAAAKCLAGLVCSMAFLIYPSELLRIGYVAAFAAALADTTATELGQLYGKRAVMLPSFRPAHPGTSGAISLEGTVLGVIAAALLAGSALALGLVKGLGAFVAVVIAAFLATTFESLVGASSLSLGRHRGQWLNLLNTMVGAGIGMALAAILSIFSQNPS